MTDSGGEHIGQMREPARLRQKLQTKAVSIERRAYLPVADPGTICRREKYRSFHLDTQTEGLGRQSTMSPPADSKWPGAKKRESGTARVLGSGASGT